MNLSAGRRTFLIGFDAPYATRGFDPDAFALRVQQLMAELAPHASLDPAVSINPYAEWWQSTGLGSLLYTRFAMMAAAAVFTDGTLPMERFATLFATAFRGSVPDASVVVVVELAANMVRCETITMYTSNDFGGCCIQAPLTPRVVPLSIPADRSGYRLLTRTTRPQGVQNQPIPSPIAPTSLPPLPTQTQAPAVTPAYSGSADNPHIPDDPPGGTPNGTPKAGFPWMGVAVGTTLLLGGAFAVTVVRKRRLLALGDGAAPPERSNPSRRTEPPTGWAVAKGSAGYNVRGPVYGRYVNGVALFAFLASWSKEEHWSCVVTGHLTAGGDTLEQACRAGEAYARKNGVSGADRRLTKKQFQARMDDPRFLPTSDSPTDSR